MTQPSGQLESNDKLLAAGSYLLPLIGIIILITDTMKAKPFMKFHAIQSIALNLVVWVLFFVLSTVTFGFGALCAPVIWLVMFWPAYKAYQGELFEIPVVTNFIKNQGWV